MQAATTEFWHMRAMVAIFGFNVIQGSQSDGQHFLSSSSHSSEHIHTAYESSKSLTARPCRPLQGKVIAPAETCRHDEDNTWHEQ